MTYVCKLDGVDISANRAGKWVHIEELPRGVDPHDVDAIVEKEIWDRAYGGTEKLKAAISDLLIHHASLCPISECAHARSLQAAAKAL